MDQASSISCRFRAATSAPRSSATPSRRSSSHRRGDQVGRRELRRPRVRRRRAILYLYGSTRMRCSPRSGRASRVRRETGACAVKQFGSRPIRTRGASGSVSRRRGRPAESAVALVLRADRALDNSTSCSRCAYLLPVALLVCARCRVTLVRVLRHRRVTSETVLGALCSYVLLGLTFAFVYLAVSEFRDAPVLRPGGAARAVGVPLLQLRHADDARLRRPLAVGRAAAGADRARGAARPGLPRHARRPARDAVGAPQQRRRLIPGAGLSSRTR